MGRIKLLSTNLSNQIAAGEVVDRPASVVKELVENAFDAQASRVQIDVGAGGVGLIRVTDDGVGMDPQDAQLAVQRHATSKLGSFDDLLDLRTFGFRGEALPSIASVSKFSLRSRPHQANEGVQVDTDGGQEINASPCGMAPGTIVQVRELFFNVPARRKFLKSTRAEAAAITSLVDSLALSSPDKTILLNRDGKKVRQWLRVSNRQQRVMGLHPDDKLAAITGQRGPVSVEAYLSPPQLARARSAALTTVINDRIIRDRVMTRVIAQAYGSVLEAGRYPVGVVYVDIDPALLDVNVHPQKAEVRFSDTRAVHDAVYRVVSDGLAKSFGLTPAVRRPPPRPAQHPAQPPSWLSRPGGTTTPATAPLVASPTVSPDNAATQPPAELQADPWGLAPPAPQPLAPSQPSLHLGPSTSKSDTPPNTPPTERPPTGDPSVRYASLHFLAQLRRMFLLCEDEDGLVILDQHAAAERVTYARLRAAYVANSVTSQRLLVPVTISIDPEEASFIEEAADEIQRTGLEMRVLGPQSALVTAVPQLLSRGAPERLARDLLDELRRAGGRKFSGAVDLALATMACHASLRSGESVSSEQANALLHSLDEVDFGGHCPHGRPLVTRLRFTDLERLMGRR